MHHNMRPVLKRFDQIGCRHGVIDNQRNACLVGNGRDGCNVHNHAAGIGDGLNKDRLGFGCDGLFKRLQIVRIRPNHIPAEFFVGMVELVDRAAIKFFCSDKLVARLQQGVKYQMFSSVARRHSDRGCATFKGCDTLFKHRAGGVSQPGVNIAEGLQAKQRRRMVHVVKHKGRRLIDRCCTRARGWVRRGASMDGKGGKTGVALCVVCHG